LIATVGILDPADHPQRTLNPDAWYDDTTSSSSTRTKLLDGDVLEVTFVVFRDTHTIYDSNQWINTKSILYVNENETFILIHA
jgi:hypothetical protein